jgi:hypothetical protein
LETLHVTGCKKLQSIPALGLFTNLRTLYVSECCEIREMPGVEYVMSLESLTVSGCPKMQWGRGVLEQLGQRLKGRLHVIL